MSDINVSVGLDTGDALKTSKAYIKSLDDIIKMSEKLEDKSVKLGVALKKTTPPKKDTDAFSSTLSKLEKTYTPLIASAKQFASDSDKVNKALKNGNITASKAESIMEGLAKKQQNLSDTARKSTKEYANLQKLLGLAADRLKKVNKEQAAYNKVLAKAEVKAYQENLSRLAKAQDTLAAKAKKARKEQEALGAALASDRVKTQGVLMARLAKHNDTFAKAASKARREQEALGAAMSRDTAGKAAKGIAAAAAAELRLAASATKANDALKKQAAQLNSTNKLWEAAKRVALLYVGINTVRSIVETTKSFDALRASLGVVFGQTNVAAEFAFISQEAVRLGISVSLAGKEYTKLAAAAKGTIIQGQGVKDIFTGISETARALNLSADDTAGAFRAITQIMSKGTVQAKHFGLMVWKRTIRKLL